jgi:hypothetical protein
MEKSKAQNLKELREKSELRSTPDIGEEKGTMIAYIDLETGNMELGAETVIPRDAMRLRDFITEWYG